MAAYRFKPGQSGNPNGRPKGIASTVRALTSAEDRVYALLTVADDPKHRDFVRANELLLAYGYGKPASTLAPEGYDPLELTGIDAEIAKIADDLAAARVQRAA